MLNEYCFFFFGMYGGGRSGGVLVTFFDSELARCLLSINELLSEKGPFKRNGMSKLITSTFWILTFFNLGESAVLSGDLDQLASVVLSCIVSCFDSLSWSA